MSESSSNKGFDPEERGSSTTALAVTITPNQKWLNFITSLSKDELTKLEVFCGNELKSFTIDLNDTYDGIHVEVNSKKIKVNSLLLNDTEMLKAVLLTVDN